MEHFKLTDKERETLNALTGSPVPLSDMLNARERRVFYQQELLGENKGCLISFTLNIPGPVKLLPGVPDAFEAGLSQIGAVLKENGYPVEKSRLILDTTGPEAFFLLPAPAKKIKELLIPIEDGSRLGRLFDIDVLAENGEKISREELNRPGRRCLLCEKPAKECARSRAHSVEELSREVAKILAQE